ncbi:hypothetical protein ACERZ8_16510 [Tateyamaria armeniaca]|uniref:DUF4760 domain-containing protein n=1 Tax=Tateyamaria armeniaca TaxID=2518930 RepID=A0ABW8V0G3_9RHOB
MTPEATAAFLATLVAVATFWIDYRSKRREEMRQISTKDRDETRDSRLRGLEERRRQVNQALEDRRFEHAQKLQATERLTDWARRATQELSLADHILNCSLVGQHQTHTFKDRVEIAARLSGLVDEGRWLFRNHHQDKFGEAKPKLNKGFRDNRLDALVKTYALLLGKEAVDPMSQRKDFAYKVQQLSIPLSEQVLKEMG